MLTLHDCKPTGYDKGRMRERSSRSLRHILNNLKFRVSPYSIGQSSLRYDVAAYVMSPLSVCEYAEGAAIFNALKYGKSFATLIRNKFHISLTGVSS